MARLVEGAVGRCVRCRGRFPSEASTPGDEKKTCTLCRNKKTLTRKKALERKYIGPLERVLTPERCSGFQPILSPLKPTLEAHSHHDPPKSVLVFTSHNANNGSGHEGLSKAEIKECTHGFAKVLLGTYPDRGLNVTFCLASNLSCRLPRLKMGTAACRFALVLGRMEDFSIVLNALLKLVESRHGRILFDSSQAVSTTDIPEASQSMSSLYHSYVNEHGKCREQQPMKSTLRLLEHIRLRQGFSLLRSTDFTTAWTEAHGLSVPRLVQMCQAWPTCPTAAKLHRITNNAIKVPAKENALGGVTFSSSNSRQAADVDLRTIMQLYHSPSLNSSFGLSYRLSARDLPPEKPVELLQHLRHQLEEPVDFDYDFNITPAHSFCDIHLDAGRGVVSATRDNGLKLWICWPWTSYNRQLFYSLNPSVRDKFAAIGAKLQAPMMVLTDDSHGIYLPPGVFHAVLTINSCFLFSMVIYDPNGIPHIASDIVGSWAQGAADRAFLSIFYRIAKMVVNRHLTQFLEPLNECWRLCRDLVRRIDGGECGDGTYEMDRRGKRYFLSIDRLMKQISSQA